MERKEAEELLKLYDAALFTWFKDTGDHPYTSEQKQLALARIREMLIQKLTEPRPPKVEYTEVLD